MSSAIRALVVFLAAIGLIVTAASAKTPDGLTPSVEDAYLAIIQEHDDDNARTNASR